MAAHFLQTCLAKKIRQRSELCERRSAALLHVANSTTGAYYIKLVFYFSRTGTRLPEIPVRLSCDCHSNNLPFKLCFVNVSLSRFSCRRRLFYICSCWAITMASSALSNTYSSPMSSIRPPRRICSRTFGCTLVR